MERILLAHGSGGRMMHSLIKDVFVSEFKNKALARLDDGASLKLPSGARIAFSSDSFVVDPIFFKGGDIGKISVCGTVNDLAMCGAEPLFLSLSVVIEEGFPAADLKKIARSIGMTSKAAGVEIVTGDTKVVPRGKADKIFINTSGIGIINKGINISGANAKPGDAVIISGFIGDHEIAVLSCRAGFKFDSEIKSDCQPLNGVTKKLLKVPGAVRCMRDPTRGGLATTLNEICLASGAGMEIDEAKVPVRDAVRSACDMLGFDPMYLANEGKFITVAKQEHAGSLLRILRSTKEGRNAAIIGRVVRSARKEVMLRTRSGGKRMLGMLSGEQLPRIC